MCELSESVLRGPRASRSAKKPTGIRPGTGGSKLTVVTDSGGTKLEPSSGRPVIEITARPGAANAWTTSINMAKLRVKDIAYRHTKDIDLTRVAQSKEWDKLANVCVLKASNGLKNSGCIPALKATTSLMCSWRCRSPSGPFVGYLNLRPPLLIRSRAANGESLQEPVQLPLATPWAPDARRRSEKVRLGSARPLLHHEQSQHRASDGRDHPVLHRRPGAPCGRHAVMERDVGDEPYRKSGVEHTNQSPARRDRLGIDPVGLRSSVSVDRETLHERVVIMECRPCIS